MTSGADVGPAFESIFTKSVRNTAPATPERIVACRIIPGSDESQPETVVCWRIAGKRTARLRYSPALTTPERVAFVAGRLGAIWPLIEQFYASALFCSGTVNLNLGDHSILSGLAFCARETAAFLIPDSVFMSTRAYAKVRLHYDTASVPWADREPVAFWRGATTGPRLSDWRDLPRVRLCALSSAHPGLVDAGVNKAVQWPRAFEDDIRAAGYMKDYVAPEGFGAWRYQIDIDGNTSSWPGLFQKLLTGSTVLKVESERGWRQWYYDRLIPWKNYVPIAADMNDLVETVLWLRDHDAAARDIGAAGRDLALSMTYEAETAASMPVIVAALKEQV